MRDKNTMPAGVHQSSADNQNHDHSQFYLQEEDLTRHEHHPFPIDKSNRADLPSYKVPASCALL